ncbi:gliding motility-associated peptidyl-prolyl isomerase GldI [Pricia sp. S334]|uniref:Peptidyl-prolyl cis-trans isomerase n=1 Tax=Pricia mediterranea TaxID=3076079 RepID=A0ABU3L928_9FLAO|nr:gliding motility-associated peptidyl-prolyl isomerase GldI [Pricia sp. S334]MDT7829982.1 gliding motility-associated peptidyl-prolyl isomerase GldI [Pricia sp. S334]
MTFQKYNVAIYSIWSAILLIVIGCGGPEPRKPIEVRSGTFFKASVERSKALLAKEEKKIQEIIEKDTAHEYVHSASGSWYRLDVANPATEYTPRPDDLVIMTYNIIGLDNDTIYSKDDIGVLTYKVDKQELFPGLRNSVKLLKEGETGTFLFPSSLAYGYHGDEKRIGVNTPIKTTLSILKIEKNNDSIP